MPFMTYWRDGHRHQTCAGWASGRVLAPSTHSRAVRLAWLAPSAAGGPPNPPPIPPSMRPWLHGRRARMQYVLHLGSIILAVTTCSLGDPVPRSASSGV